MRRLILFGIVTFMITAIAGCAIPKPEFNQAYLPNAVPGQPQKRIDLPQDVAYKASVIKGGLFGKSTTHLPTSLYWVEEDNLLFNVFSEDNKNLLHSFLVIPSTGEIKLLEGAEKYALLGEIEKNINVVYTETAGKKFLEALATAASIALLVAAAAAGGGGGGGGSGPNFSDDYKGKIENNGTVLDFDISIKAARGRIFSSTSWYSLTYAAKNERTGNTLKGKTRIVIGEDGHWSTKRDIVQYYKDKVQNGIRDWLKSWRASPDGRYYVIGYSTTFVDPEYKHNPFTKLIKNYDRVYAGFDINPRWDKIALLNIEEDKKTKQMNYWIEFYPFDYRNQKMTNRRPDNSECCMVCLPIFILRNIWNIGKEDH